MDDDGSIANRIAPDGSPYSHFIMMDFNALYGAMQMKPMPTTPGIQWTWKNGRFHKSVMATDTSLPAVQWLSWVEATHPLCKAGFPMQSKYFQGEVTVADYAVDGYVTDGNTVQCFEFDGCFFHGHNCAIGTVNEAQAVRDCEKFEAISAVAEIHYMRECEWDPSAVANVPTKLARILHTTDSAEALLAWIKSGELFGFLMADVDGPDDVINRLVKSNFGPIFRNVELTEDHLSPYMRQRYSSRGCKVGRSLVQTFRASGILISTELAKFYMEIGLQIFNIKWFTQYLAERSIAPFMKSVTSMRVEATKEGDESKSCTAKLFGNSGKVFN